MTPDKIKAWLSIEAMARLVAAEAERDRYRPLAMEALRMRATAAEAERDGFRAAMEEIVEWAKTMIDLAPMIEASDGSAKYSDMVTKGAEYVLAICSIRGVKPENP